MKVIRQRRKIVAPPEIQELLKLINRTTIDPHLLPAGVMIFPAADATNTLIIQFDNGNTVVRYELEVASAVIEVSASDPAFKLIAVRT